MKKIRLFTFGCLLLSTGLISAQNYQINSPEDDAEESAGFTIVTLNSPVIDLTSDPGDPKFRKQLVGLRFNNFQLQKGASLSNCYLQFRVAQTSSAVTYLSIRGEKTGNAAAFQTINRNLSMRPKTIAKTIWNNVEAWTQEGAMMKSPDISQILTEIISQPEWQPGNAIALYIEGNGDRHASAFESEQGNAIQLVLNGGTIAASPVKPAIQSAPATAPAKPETQPALSTLTASKSQPENQPSSPVSGTLKTGSSLEETINSTPAPVKVGLVSQIEVTIPQGVAPEGTKVSIKKITKEYKYDEINILNAMDVALSCGSTFEKPLEIKMFFEKNKLATSGNVENIRPAYFDEIKKQWVPYQEFSTNAQEGWVAFKTYHLTTVSLYEFLTTGLYTMKFENADCTVYYCSSTNATHTPMKNSEYNGFKEETWYKKEGDKDYYVPYMVQDIANWMSVVKRAFKDSLKVEVPRKVNVYVKFISDLWGNPTAWGEYGSVAGCIYLNNIQKAPIAGVTNSEFVRSNVAHEYFHLVQDYYYVMNKGKIGLWWLEALATQADQIALGNIKNCECEVWAQKTLGQNKVSNIENRFLENTMATSWDNNSDEHFYGAGFFLRYLAYFRPVAKVDLIKLMIEGGSNTELSYFRTILNNYLSNYLKSTINQEYESFAKWVYNNNESRIKFFVKSTWDQNHKVIMIEDSFTSTTISEKLPPLSSIIVKLRWWSDKKQDFKLERELQSLGPGIKVFLCDSKEVGGPRMVVKELKTKPQDGKGVNFTETTSLGITNTFNDFLIVNTNTDKEGSFSLFVKNPATYKP